MNVHILDAKDAGFHEVGKSTIGELLGFQAKPLTKGGSSRLRSVNHPGRKVTQHPFSLPTQYRILAFQYPYFYVDSRYTDVNIVQS